MEKKYSVAFQPPQNGIDFVKTLKDSLCNEVGNFGSRNSVAHITICELIIDESAIDKIIVQISKVCGTFTPIHVNLNSFGSYPKVGAFYIATNGESKDNLKAIMSKVQDALRNFKIGKTDDPHMTIARRLTPENLNKASELFNEIDIDILFDNIVLREYDPNKRQYVVIKTFPFGSNPQPELIQGSLF